MTPEQQLQKLLTEAQELTIKMREALRHLPNYQPKPKLATNYEEVVEAVKPSWVCCADGSFAKAGIKSFYIPTEAAAKQSRAFTQIKNLEAYCAERFEGERDYTVFLNCDMNLRYQEVDYAPFHFTRDAAEWLIANHTEPFLVFYGVK